MLYLQLHFSPQKNFKVFSPLVLHDFLPHNVTINFLFAGKTKGDFVSKEERTATDKKRARRKKKFKQRLKHKQIKSKENELKKLNPGMKNNFAKEKVKKDLERLLKDKSVSHVSLSFACQYFSFLLLSKLLFFKCVNMFSLDTDLSVFLLKTRGEKRVFSKEMVSKMEE